MTVSEARTLLGLADNCTPQIKDVGNNCYRINVFEKIIPIGTVIPILRLTRSAYVCLTDEGYKDFTR